MKKRILTLFLAMILAFAYAVPAAVYANEENAKTVTVTSLPEFQVGAPVADATITTEPIAGVEVKTVWTVYKPGFDPEDEYTHWFPLEGKYLAAHPVFEADTVYELSIQCDQYVEFAFSNALKEWEDAEVWSDGEVYFINFGRYSDTTEITKLEVEISEAVAGNVASVNKITAFDEDGNQLDAAAMEDVCYWATYTNSAVVAITGSVFEKEEVYGFMLNLRATAGYSFPEYLTLVLNGEEQELMSADPKTIDSSYTYSLMTPLDYAELKGLPEAVAGEKIPAELELVNGTVQHSVEFLWEEEVTDEWGTYYQETEDETFVEGKKYRMHLYFYSGHQPMNEDFYFLIDGKEYEPTELEVEYSTAVVDIVFDISGEDGILGESEDEEEALKKDPGDRAEDTSEQDQGDKAEREPEAEKKAEVKPETVDDEKKAPETGDSNTILPFAILIAAGAAMTVLRRREQ